MTKKRRRKRRSKQYKDLPKGVDSLITKGGKDAYYRVSYNITHEPIEEILKRIPEEITNQLSELKFQIYNEPKEAMPKLLILKEKYPDTPMRTNNS